MPYAGDDGHQLGDERLGVEIVENAVHKPAANPGDHDRQDVRPHWEAGDRVSDRGDDDAAQRVGNQEVENHLNPEPAQLCDRIQERQARAFGHPIADERELAPVEEMCDRQCDTGEHDRDAGHIGQFAEVPRP
ncbi:MAG: hypothetical protein JO199_04500 [Candidatus Eremiobacteraeota bacterium]|nr:hypothetical protein [Candidatus Eremiobacteraeota bacterium]